MQNSIWHSTMLEKFGKRKKNWMGLQNSKQQLRNIPLLHTYSTIPAGAESYLMVDEIL